MDMRTGKVGWVLGIAAVLFPLVIYAFTLCRTVGFVDAGELCVASRTLGVAHPTGYPLYVLLGRLFSLFPLGAIIVRTNFMSAFFAALSALFLYLAISRLLASFETGQTKARLLALFCACSFTFSTTIWNQAVVTEVYSLTAFFASVLLFLAFSDDERAPLLFAYVFGLSLSNHMSALLVGIPCGIYMLSARGGLLRRLPLMVILFLFGLSTYIYLPIRANQNPLMNWGNPATLERFVWHITGKQYRVWMFNWEAQALIAHLFQFGRLIADQYTPFLLWLPLLGVAVARKFKAVYLILSIFVLDLLYSLNYDIPDIDAYYIPAFMVMAVASAFGLHFLFRKTVRKSIVWVGVFVLLIPFGTHYYKCDMSRNQIAYEYGENYLRSIEKNGLCLTNNWDIYSPILYMQYIEGKRDDVIMIDKELLRRSWYFDYLKKQFPKTFDMSRGEIGSYLDQLYQFEHGTLASPAEIQKRFIEMVDSFITHHMKTGRAYTTFVNGIDFDARDTAKGLEKVLHGLVFEFSREKGQREFDYGTLNLGSSFRTRTYKDERARSNLRVYPKLMLISGIGLMNEGRYADANPVFQKILEIDKNNLIATLNLGGTQLMLGQYQVAIENFEKVLKADPTNELALKGLAAARLKLRQR